MTTPQTQTARTIPERAASAGAMPPRSGAQISPKSQALAYRIWCHAEPLGWDCTVADIADALGETSARIRRVIEVKRWANRLRVTRDSGKRHVVHGDYDLSGIDVVPMEMRVRDAE